MAELLSREQIAKERAFFRDLIFRTYDYKTHEPEVDRFHASDAKVKIISCPARTSKSYAGWKDVEPDIFYFAARAKLSAEQRKFIIWIVAPHYDLAKEFDYAWDDLVLAKGAKGFDYKIGQKSNSPGSGKMYIQLLFGKNPAGLEIEVWIEVKTAANDNTLQSEEVDIAVLSEAAELDERVWTKYLSTRVGRSIWPTTPKRKARWIYEQMELGRKKPELRIEDFRFTIRANPKYNCERYWLEHAKAEDRAAPGEPNVKPRDINKAPTWDNGHDCFSSETNCNAMKDPEFAEQFGGVWNFHKGTVVPLRLSDGPKGEPPHVIDFDREWFKWCDVHVSFDYGYADPSVVLFWLIGPEQVVLRRSIYEEGLVADDLVDRTQAIIREMNWGSRITRMIGDPKKPDVVEVFRRRGLPIWDIDKIAQADRKAGHLTFMNYLSINRKTGEPFMLIHADNPRVIREFEELTYKEDAKDLYATGAFARDCRDDAYDATRYFVQSNPPVSLKQDTRTLAHSDFDRVRRSILNHRRRIPRTPTVGSAGIAGVGL